jgi:hypothetical protein
MSKLKNLLVCDTVVREIALRELVEVERGAM